MATTYKKYTDPEGNTYTTLPKVWNNWTPISEQFVLSHGWTVEEITIPDPIPPDETNFKIACKQFRTVCGKIGTFIGKEDFKGGFDQYEEFITSEAAEADRATAGLLASMWSGSNQYCKYEGSKIGYGQPEWWYKCWQYTDEELAQYTI